MKKLVLVWGKNIGGRPQVIIPLEYVTKGVYDTYTCMFGTPKGRTEEFIN